MTIGSKGYDPIEFVDEIGKAEDDSKGCDGANEPIDEDILEILAEILLLEIISSCKDHGGKQRIEEDFLIEIYILNLASNIECSSE